MSAPLLATNFVVVVYCGPVFDAFPFEVTNLDPPDMKHVPP